MPKSGAFQEKLRKIFEKKPTQTREAKRGRLDKKVGKLLRKEQPVRDWTVAGPDKSVGELLEDIELDECASASTFASGTKYVRRWKDYECQQCPEPGVPLRERKYVYRSLEAYIDHLTTHGIEYCQSCDVQCPTKGKFKAHKRYGKHKDA